MTNTKKQSELEKVAINPSYDDRNSIEFKMADFLGISKWGLP